MDLYLWKHPRIPTQASKSWFLAVCLPVFSVFFIFLCRIKHVFLYFFLWDARSAGVFIPLMFAPELCSQHAHLTSICWALCLGAISQQKQCMVSSRGRCFQNGVWLWSWLNLWGNLIDRHWNDICVIMSLATSVSWLDHQIGPEWNIYTNINIYNYLMDCHEMWACPRMMNPSDLVNPWLLLNTC